MPGSNPTYLKQGRRSEILADYLFGTWGAVTPVRDDYGIDLFCTLSEEVGKRFFVRDYFTVQVKSESVTSWNFKDQQEVKWLIEYPTPLFLAMVDKDTGTVSVYHVMPRFYLWALSALPERLELIPEKRDDGEFIQWQPGGEVFSLSAPVIRVTIADLINEDTMAARRKVFEYWVRYDRENCDLVRQGLLRFRMPHRYRVNELPNDGMAELGDRLPDIKFLERGILRLTEAAECIGGQLFAREDRHGALRATLLVSHLMKSYPKTFENEGRWQGSIPGDMGNKVCKALNKAAGAEGYDSAGLDKVSKALDDDNIVSNFLTNLPNRP